jgi:hypothetical protein
MITSLSWIPRGAARAHPVRFEFSAEEIERVKRLAAMEAKLEQQEREDEDAEDGDFVPSGSTFRDQSLDIEQQDDNEDSVHIDLPPELKMDTYDDEEEDVEEERDVGAAEFEGEAFDLLELGGGAAFANEADFEDDDDEDAEVHTDIHILRHSSCSPAQHIVDFNFTFIV